MNNQQQIARLINYIEENLRASKTAGLEFVDRRHFKGRLMNRQNHVIFGGRGAGKSTLLRSVDTMDTCITIPINLEDFKDITFPNVILYILAASFRILRKEVKKEYPWYKIRIGSRGFCRSLKKTEDELHSYVSEPDLQAQHIRTKTSQEKSDSRSVGINYNLAAGGEGRTTESSEVEIQKTVPQNKLYSPLLQLTRYKSMFSRASKICNDKPIFLLLDDFHFVSKEVQPILLEYLYRMTKDTNLFLKLATIKHRSHLYSKQSDTYIGVELGHDMYEIDMDNTMDDFEELKSFMKQLLDGANRASFASLDIDLLFEDEGFSQLCLASGGVPRDFLSLFVNLLNRIVAIEGKRIGKVLVTEEAGNSLNSKLHSLEINSAEDINILVRYLNNIKERTYYDKRTNVFLGAKAVLEDYLQSR